jgi:prophage antirepressor-like protein
MQNYQNIPEQSNGNGLQLFYFNNSPIRVIKQPNGEPLFSANDVCDILGYTNPHDAISTKCKKDGVAKCEVIDSLGRKQNANFISEGNLYRLILKCTKPEAEPFERFVCDEVLPQIRKTGSYISKPLGPLEILEMQVALMKQQELELQAVKEEVKQVKALITTSDTNFYSIVGYSVLYGVKVDNPLAIKLGTQAGKKSRQLGSLIGKTSDPRFGTVHTYHQDILKNVFDEYFNNLAEGGVQ